MTQQKKIKLDQGVDISENEILAHYPDVLAQLLRDHTTQNNIFWGTDNYQTLGNGYAYHDPIKPELITGARGKVIMPRVKKDKLQQAERVRNMAEVFTPSWICNAQNNLVDAAWFGREGVFNTEVCSSDDRHSWSVTQDKIAFPAGKTWQDYIRSLRLEITCGEAPYITSRYDTTTGEFIPVERRIGLLDRKLRVINENVEKSGSWLKAAQDAYRSTYAYEWQGDSLLLAREAMLYTFIENYQLKFQRLPQEKSIRYIAYIISWNVWQMDGLKCVIPESCHEEQEENLFAEDMLVMHPCPGCQNRDVHKHNGIYCLVRDWQARDQPKIEFRSLLKGAKA